MQLIACLVKLFVEVEDEGLQAVALGVYFEGVSFHRQIGGCLARFAGVYGSGGQAAEAIQRKAEYACNT